jgi:hypothetical protein
MAFSGMLCHVVHVRTDISEELSTFIIRVMRIGALGTLTITSNRRTLRRNVKVLFVTFKMLQMFVILKYMCLI